MICPEGSLNVFGDTGDGRKTPIESDPAFADIHQCGIAHLSIQVEAFGTWPQAAQKHRKKYRDGSKPSTPGEHQNSW